MTTLEVKKGLICIDVGHGGRDPGVVYEGIKEKDIVYEIAEKISTLTHRPLLLTRRRDVFLPLRKRVEVANRNDACFFLSLHCNAVPDRLAKGIEAWYFSDTGKRLAELFLDRLFHFATVNRGAKKGRFFVLRKTGCPAVLLGLGFLSNEEDRYRLVDPDWQRLVSIKIAKVLDELCALAIGG